MSPEVTVFVVDDDRAVRESLALLVQSVGLEVETFAGANDFLDAYQPDRRGCLITDIRMPGMSGLELQERLSADHRLERHKSRRHWQATTQYSVRLI